MARVLGTSLNVAEIFDRLAAAVRPVLDFDIRATRLPEPEGPFEKGERLAAEGRSVRGAVERLEDFSFTARLLSRVPAYPADRTILEDGIRSFVAVPLIFREKVGGVLAFGKRQPDWFDKSDLDRPGARSRQG